jgi:DNA mismatch repair protein MutS2
VARASLSWQAQPRAFAGHGGARLSFGLVNGKALSRLEFDKVRRLLADHTAFSGGRRLALALEPTADVEDVRWRQGLTTQARAYGDRIGAPPLGGAHDLRDEVVGAARGKTLLPPELLDLRDTIAAARRMRKSLGGGMARTHWPALEGLAERLDPSTALHDAIQATFDDDGNVLDSASPELRRIRRELRLAHDRLMRHLESIVASSPMREVLQEPLITQRDGRYVVPVRSEMRARLPGVVHDTSDSGATVFIEPLPVVEAGNRHRELARDEEKEVARVLRELSAQVGEQADVLVETIEVLAALDLAFACGELAFALRATAPEIADAGRAFLSFPAARHPLLDPSTVVPVDVRVGEDFQQLVITGPNTGGKTVALKTTGLLVLMAQSGLHVPAGDGARLGVFDDVYVDIGDEQSIEQSLSTFSSHMTNIIGVLDVATPSSLVLLDELGAGTDPVEGAALAEALLEHLRAREIAVVASTHYSSLKVYAHGTPGVANASVEFDVETLRPTFELTIGLPGRSNALAIARRLGLPEPIVDDARGRMAASDVVMEDLLAELRDARRHAAEDRDAAAAARRQADTWAADLDRALHELKAERADVLDRARRAAEADLAAAREAIAGLLRDARRDAATAEAVARAAQKLDRVGEVLGEVMAPAPEVVVAAAGDLAPGVWVYVASAKQHGEVLRVKGGEAEVQLGRLRLTVPVADLTIAGAAPGGGEVAERATRLKRPPGADESVSIELDLRGMRVDEGLEQVDLVLDRAILSGVPWVRIIHGHGTGAMKAAVRETLRHHRGIKRSRPGERGEGGDGVTVVYFE